RTWKLLARRGWAAQEDAPGTTPALWVGISRKRHGDTLGRAREATVRFAARSCQGKGKRGVRPSMERKLAPRTAERHGASFLRWDENEEDAGEEPLRGDSKHRPPPVSIRIALLPARARNATRKRKPEAPVDVSLRDLAARSAEHRHERARLRELVLGQEDDRPSLLL